MRWITRLSVLLLLIVTVVGGFVYAFTLDNRRDNNVMFAIIREADDLPAGQIERIIEAVIGRDVQVTRDDDTVNVSTRRHVLGYQVRTAISRRVR